MVINLSKMENEKRLVSKNGGYVLRSQSHSNEIIKQFDEQRKRRNKNLCDVMLSVEGKRFAAHKAVLAACSDYFKYRFATEDVENRPCKRRRTVRSAEDTKDHDLSQPDKPLDLPGLKTYAFQKILDNMYTSQLEINRQNLYDLLYTSCLLQVSDVTEACLTILSREPSWQMPDGEKRSLLVINSCLLKSNWTNSATPRLPASTNQKTRRTVANHTSASSPMIRPTKSENRIQERFRFHPQSSSAPPATTGASAVESFANLNATTKNSSAINVTKSVAAEKRRQYANPQAAKFFRSAKAAEVAELGNDRNDVSFLVKSRDFARSQRSPLEHAEKQKRNRTVSEGSQVDCQMRSSERALDLTRDSNERSRRNVEANKSAQPEHHETLSVYKKNARHASDGVSIPERKGNVSRRSFAYNLQARSHSDAELYYKPPLNFGSFSERLTKAISHRRLYETPYPLPPYLAAVSFDYSDLTSDGSYAALPSDYIPVPPYPFGAVAQLSSAAVQPTAAASSPIYADRSLPSTPLAWSRFPSFLSPSLEAGEAQSRKLALLSRDLQSLRQASGNFESVNRRRYEYADPKTNCIARTPAISPPPYKSPDKQYDHVMKRRLMAACSDSGNETEGSASVDGFGIGAKNVADQCNKAAALTKSIPAKASVAMVTSVVGGRCDPHPGKERDMPRHEQCVI